MESTRESWDTVHDLALVYIALAYGTDSELSERELDTLTKRLEGWSDDTESSTDEVVLHAMTIYLEEDTEREVARSISSLSEELDQAQRRRAMHDVIRIAEADGVLLSTEQSLIATIADSWNVKETEKRLLDQTRVEVESVAAWSLLHDIAFIFLVVAHSTDDELSNDEIDVMLNRLGEWQADLSEDEVRAVLRSALDFYSQGPDEDVLRQSVKAVQDTLSVMQRLVVLDDLNQIAQADGTVLDTEREMIRALADAWGVVVHVNGQH